MTDPYSNQASGSIVVHRKLGSASVLVPFTIELDGIPVGRLLPMRSQKISVRPGLHSIRVRRGGIEFSPVLSVEVRSGTSVKIVCAARQNPQWYPGADTLFIAALGNPTNRIAVPQNVASVPEGFGRVTAGLHFTLPFIFFIGVGLSFASAAAGISLMILALLVKWIIIARLSQIVSNRYQQPSLAWLSPWSRSFQVAYRSCHKVSLQTAARYAATGR